MRIELLADVFSKALEYSLLHAWSNRCLFNGRR